MGKVSGGELVDYITNNKSDIIITKKNDIFVSISTDKGIAQELSDHFTFEVPGAKFMPAYKTRAWDGKIRLFNMKTSLIYYGLKFEVVRFADTRGYTFSIFDESNGTDKEDVAEFIKYLNIPLELRDYQTEAIHHSIKQNRALLVSPTASGKSLIIYCLIRYYLLKQEEKILLLVPTISLVSQMFKDFEDYGFNSETNCHMITGGKDKDSQQRIYISTWQSVYKEKRPYFEKFGVIFVDEAHLAKAASLKSIMEKLPDCKYRFGLTGTLDGTESNKLVLSGLFDVPKKVVSTKELMDAGTISKLKINSLILNHSVPDKKIAMRVKTYQEECDYLVLNAARNQFISRLATSLEGNTLVLFQYVEKHGIPLTKQIRSLTTKNVRYISGMVKAEEREETRDVTEANDDVIIVASYQTYSTGINIKNLHNIIFAFPTKSQVRVLQSIGRGLRLHDSKDKCNVYDIADDIRKGKKKNYTLNHFYARYNIYNEAEFDVSTEIINL